MLLGLASGCAALKSFLLHFCCVCIYQCVRIQVSYEGQLYTFGYTDLSKFSHPCVANMPQAIKDVCHVRLFLMLFYVSSVKFLHECLHVCVSECMHPFVSPSTSMTTINVSI